MSAPYGFATGTTVDLLNRKVIGLEMDLQRSEKINQKQQELIQNLSSQVEKLVEKVEEQESELWVLKRT